MTKRATNVYESQEGRLPQVTMTILHLGFRVFCSLEHGECQFWCKFLDFCDSNAENCYAGIPEAACNQMDKQTQQLYYSLHHVLQHTAPSIRKLENPFDFMIHRSTRLLTLIRANLQHFQKPTRIITLTRTAILDQGWKIYPCKKVSLSSRNIPCKQTQLLCQAYFKPLHYCTAITVRHMERNLWNQSVPNN